VIEEGEFLMQASVQPFDQDWSHAQTLSSGWNIEFGLKELSGHVVSIGNIIGSIFILSKAIETTSEFLCLMIGPYQFRHFASIGFTDLRNDNLNRR